MLTSVVRNIFDLLDSFDDRRYFHRILTRVCGKPFVIRVLIGKAIALDSSPDKDVPLEGAPNAVSALL